MCLFDNLGMCIFAGFCLSAPENLQLLVEMAAARFGGAWDVDRLMGIAVQTIHMEKQFNNAAGFTDKDNRLPQFFYEERLDSVNAVFDFSDDELKQAIVDYVMDIPLESVEVTNVRHKQALSLAKKSLEHAAHSTQMTMSAEFIALDLRDALHRLGEITGETTTEDILDHIFATFCIGK